jgi:hypothetical protein
VIVYFVYNYFGVIESCDNGELKIGEEVKITLQSKNPLWPAFIIGTVIGVAVNHHGRDYTIEFDNAVLNGAPNFDGCDCTITPYCCCEKLQDRFTNLAPSDINGLTAFVTAIIQAQP